MPEHLMLSVQCLDYLDVPIFARFLHIQLLFFVQINCFFSGACSATCECVRAGIKICWGKWGTMQCMEELRIH